MILWGVIRRIEDAIKDIKEQATGNLRWDESRGAWVPESVQEWAEGEPENWNDV